MKVYRLKTRRWACVDKWSFSHKIGASAAWTLCCFGLGYTLALKNAIQEYHALQIQSLALKKEIGLNKSQQLVMKKYRLDHNKVEQHFHHLLSSWPKKQALSKVFDTLSVVAQKNGVQFEHLDPAPMIFKDFYVKLPIHMVLFGTYNQLLHFLNQASTLQWVITWHDFALSSQATKRNQTQLRLDIAATVYQSNLP